MRRIALAAAAGLALILAGCGNAAPKDPAPAGPGGRIFLIIGENTSASQITAKAAPYLVKTLKPKAAWISSYRSFPKSSSLGDYIAMTSGQFTKCEANNDLPDKCHQKVDNVFQQLQSTGPGVVRLQRERRQSVRHRRRRRRVGAEHLLRPSQPRDLLRRPARLRLRRGDQAQGPVPAARPRHGHDGAQRHEHDGRRAGLGQSRRSQRPHPQRLRERPRPVRHEEPGGQFDAFLAREIPKIQASPAFGADSTIIVTWDEGGDPPFNPGNPLLLALGPNVKTGVVSNGPLQPLRAPANARGPLRPSAPGEGPRGQGVAHLRLTLSPPARPAARRTARRPR